MKQKDFFALNLPKWPCLLVFGSKITQEQAAVLLVRTDSLYFPSNDSELVDELYNATGLLSESGGVKDWQVVSRHNERVRKSCGVIGLEYLNNSRIVSSYVGGPHGWCDWDGNIFCNSYNIGKWPSVEDVFKEWKKIAKAFPFLDLRSQLLSGEQCEDDLQPVVEFVVKNGKVKMEKPSCGMLSVDDDDSVSSFAAGFSKSTRNREFGCTMEMFKAAIALAKVEKGKTKQSLAGVV